MTDVQQRPDFTQLADLASRRFGGSVIVANDELFAEKENLIKPEPSLELTAFGSRGGLFDGWETRRRRGDVEGPDWALVRLGLPGVVRGVVVDTSHFTGNYPAEISIEAAAFEGYPNADEVAGFDGWQTLVARTACRGDTLNPYPVEDQHRWTHIRLSIYPDGGVARLRVHGEVVPDPRLLAGAPLDLAAMELGGRVTACSDRFYCDPALMLQPSAPEHMDGWETRRRRGPGNDWAELELAAQGVVHLIEVDTTYNVGNAPGACRLLAVDATIADPADPAVWWELLSETELQPDTRHRLRPGQSHPATHVRFDIYPDGGVARLRLFGDLTPSGFDTLHRAWQERLPSALARRSLDQEGLTR